MAKGMHISNMYAGNHSDKTLKGMMTLKEDGKGPQGPLLTDFDKDSGGKHPTYRNISRRVCWH
jgi:hypothetical protein